MSKSLTKPKGPIKYKISLSDEQKLTKAIIYNSPITFVLGNAGSGKTQVAVLTALDMFFKKEVSSIIVTRPAVSKEQLGYLPGDIDEKMSPYLAPIKQCMYSAYSPDKIDKHFGEKEFQILPLAFTKGVTYKDSVVIVDEFQNIDHVEFKMVLSRLGKNSKLILCGDDKQIDLKNENDSCIHLVQKMLTIPGIGYSKLLENHRHPILNEIFKII